MTTLTYEQFITSLKGAEPPADTSPLLQALWHEANKDWHRAHELAQQDDSADGAWLHAYLHRVEGDLANAAYWYRRAGKSVEHGPLAQEWQALVGEFLARDA